MTLDGAHALAVEIKRLATTPCQDADTYRQDRLALCIFTRPEFMSLAMAA